MDKTKHGLIISHFLALKVRALRWRKRKRKKRRRRKKEEEKKKKIQVWKFEIYVWNISFVWNSCLEHLFCLELLNLLVRKPP